MANNSNQDEYNKALQNLLTLSGKKAEIKKVWENANPTSNFGEQDISIDLSDVDFVLIETFYATDTLTYVQTHIAALDLTYISYLLAQAAYSSIGYHTRPLKATTSGVHFYNNYMKGSITSTSAGTVNNKYQIPAAIYTVKGVI